MSTTKSLPLLLPGVFVAKPGSAPAAPDIDTGGYDVMIGGHGFRLATDQQFYYSRATEPTTVHRFDSSLEPGEQSLSPLPWIKSQSSFHAGAGQQNLEQGFTAFQYQQEQVEHIRFDTCLGVDVWTPGQVTRLPDCRFFNFGFNSSCMVTATVNGVDYAVIGGLGDLYMASWPSGPDADPTVGTVDLTGSTFGGPSNCNVTSIATDGTNYYAVIQLVAKAPFGASDTLTYIVSGVIGSTAPPNILYKVPGVNSGAVRHNLCTNPSFETDTTGWSNGQTGSSVASSSAQAFVGTKSMLSTWGTSTAGSQSVLMNFTSVIGRQYALSAYVYVPAGSPRVVVAGTKPGSLPAAGSTSSPSNVTGSWQRLYATYTAQTTTSQIVIQALDAPTVGQQCYVDAVLIEDSPSLNAYFDGSTATTSNYSYGWDGTAQESSSTATPIGTVTNVPSCIGWVKERLVGAVGNSVYELPPTSAGFAPLPAPRYTHPVASCVYTAISESPTGILISDLIGSQANILLFTLDSSGGTPVLAGGATIASLPPGETVQAMQSYLASFIGIGTTQGVRIGTFDTYTGALKLGPLTLDTTQPVLALAGRDRFIYAGFTNQQADGKTGLARIDLSMVVDAAGRMAYAPDLRPPTTAPTGLGAVTGVSLLPKANRVLFVTPEGLHVEGSGPGNNGDAWLRTSRIRYDTSELKLFKLGRVHGSLDVASIQITGIAPFQENTNLGTFGFVSEDPGEFRLPSGLHEWIQLQFDLQGSGCVLNSYQTKAYPAPARQHVFMLTVNCFTNETDRFGLDVTDPETPRQRLQNVVDLERIGDEVRYVEFTNEGSVATIVLIDQLEFKSFSRPNVEDDFGGYITFRLRTTEN